MCDLVRPEIGAGSFQVTLIGYVTACEPTMTIDSSESAGSAVGDEEPSANGVLILPPSVERELGSSDESLGTLGRPFDHRSPFFIGLSGAFGVAVDLLPGARAGGHIECPHHHRARPLHRHRVGPDPRLSCTSWRRTRCGGGPGDPRLRHPHRRLRPRRCRSLVPRDPDDRQELSALQVQHRAREGLGR